MNTTTQVLVIDDEEVVRLSYQRTLASEHCQVQLAPSGPEGLRLMGSQSFDVVLLDLRMPGMDGLSVLKVIKERWPDSEVVVITGYPSIDTAKQAVSMGAYDYLAKPAGPDQVISAANSALLHKRWTLHRQPAPTLH